jgi:hypothetical protein
VVDGMLARVQYELRTLSVGEHPRVLGRDLASLG